MLRLKRKIYKRRQFCCKEIAGFTMVEIIVTLAILSTSMLAIFGTLRMCTAADNSSQRLTEAVFLAEKLLSETMLSNQITYQTTKGSKDQFSWQIQTAPTGMDNLATVCVSIQWHHQQKLREYLLFSLMHIRDLKEGK